MEMYKRTSPKLVLFTCHHSTNNSHTIIKNIAGYKREKGSLTTSLIYFYKVAQMKPCV